MEKSIALRLHKIALITTRIENETDEHGKYLAKEILKNIDKIQEDLDNVINNLQNVKNKII